MKLLSISLFLIAVTCHQRCRCVKSFKENETLMKLPLEMAKVFNPPYLRFW